MTAASACAARCWAKTMSIARSRAPTTSTAISKRFITQYCWGEAWGDDTLSPRERSILNLGMIASLGKMEEFQTHVRGALRNGLTPNEIRAVLTQIAVYCGVPVGVDCFRIAKVVLAEGKKT
jgi:4-carboxymuconolactone decarboxylase